MWASSDEEVAVSALLSLVSRSSASIQPGAGPDNFAVQLQCRIVSIPDLQRAWRAGKAEEDETTVAHKPLAGFDNRTTRLSSARRKESGTRLFLRPLFHAYFRLYQRRYLQLKVAFSAFFKLALYTICIVIPEFCDFSTVSAPSLQNLAEFF